MLINRYLSTVAVVMHGIFSWSLLMQLEQEMGTEFTNAGSIFCPSSNPLEKNWGLQMLNQVEFTLTKKESAKLLWNCFVNVHGHGIQNVPCGLHMEHLNRIFKDAVYGLQANKTLTAIVWDSRSLGLLYHLLEQFDKEIGIKINFHLGFITNQIWKTWKWL